MIDREIRINVRASEEEASMLRALAEREGLSISDYIRQHVRRAYRDAFGDKPVKKSAKK